MTTNPSAELLDNLLTVAGQTTAVREEVRVWSMSGVERVTFPDGTTAIFKYANKPFDGENQALHLAHTLGVPVPQVHASVVLDGWLGMLMEDLGPSEREADDLDGVATAVVLHGTRTAPPLPVLDQDRLRKLPARALGHLERLRKADRWQDVDDIEDALDRIAQAADVRSAGATLAPFGWVHSEFHPTSLHIGKHGWRLLDFARAFTGPGLLDLASWHGTIEPPHPVRLRVFLEQYVTAGGTSDALAPRGGLAAESWALGWHRMWAVEWFMEQSIRWINDPATDPAYIKAVRRHLSDVLHLLEI
ncbi:aminoglycoside phosphotransferase family protein [Streptomyces sp. NPDC088341]|uniref:phosphotransferase family protein n=1 Tax=Streptomyces sp. NPDC088341 TaxID=3154870 RepID=UPI00341A8673